MSSEICFFKTLERYSHCSAVISKSDMVTFLRESEIKKILISRILKSEMALN